MTELTSMPILDVAIGLAFIYFLFSLVCSSVMEAIAHVLGLRGRMLIVGLRELVGDKLGDLLEKLNEHALEKPKPWFVRQSLVDRTKTSKSDSTKPLKWIGEKWRNSNRPSYISRRTLRRALADLGDAGLAQQVERDFDASMERVSGWYKRQTQTIVFCVALVLAVSLNADSLTMADRLMKDDSLRATIVAKAVAETAAPTGPTGGTSPSGQVGGRPASPSVADYDEIAKNIDRVQYLGLPIGWTEANLPDTSNQGFWADAGDWMTKLLGWLITVFALMLGAPFWFDVLSKAANLRASGATAAKKPKK